MRGLRLAGKVFIAVYDDDTGLIGSVLPGGNTTELTLQADGDDLEVISTDYDNHGAALDSMADPKPTTGTWKINRFAYHTLALACAGGSTELDVSVAAKTNNAFVANLGVGKLLAEVPIDTLVVKDSTDTTTYVEGTHYSINEQLAILTILDPQPGTGGIAEGATLHLAYNETAQAGYEIAGSTAIGKKIMLLLDGRNLFSGQKILLRIPKLKLKPAGTISFIGSEAAEQQFDFTCIVADGETAAYTLRVQE